ncbi:hypothetical protein HHI36_002898 [Cryptolaemus montrouzieri]|uniref:Uncharacterized protein n=1 Tax=Cryptolaemus montrouzieri TaxID=559131 RepID=A0ABD2PBV8_9CUCU
MNDLETELKYTEPIEIKNELNVLKPIKSEFMDTTLVGNNIKLFDHGKRTTKLSITNSEMNLKTKDPFMKKISNDFFNTVSNSKFESKLALSELGNIKRCKQCSLLGMNHKDILECSKLQKRIGDGESVISETANNDKTAVSPRVRYIRLTNEPNLNLFLP